MTEQAFPDLSKFKIHEHAVLEKFEGEAHPDNLVERIILEQGEIVRIEKIEGGEVVETLTPEEGGDLHATD